MAEERAVIRALVWVLWLAIVGSFGALLFGGVPAEDGDGSAVAYTVFVLAFATTGALVAIRRPRNPIGWILLGAGLSYAVGGVSIAVHDEAVPLVMWVSTWVWMAGVGPAATFGLLLFPDGRLPSRRWRAAAWLAAAANVMVLTGIALEPGRFEDSTVENPLGLEAAPAVPDLLADLGAAALAVAIAVSIASVAARFRRSHGVEREQLKWLAYSGVVVGIALAAALVIEIVAGERAVNLTNTIVSLSLAVVPVAMGIAILRHRLYDVDVVINRTLVYGGLTATLAGTYLGSVLLIGLAVGKSDVAIAVSTLAVAALFRPARARIQGAVDRRFYRRRYDAAQTLEAFGGRLRDEIDLETLGADLSGVVRDTVQPAHVSLWLRTPR
jgi:hypothetical protein